MITVAYDAAIVHAKLNTDECESSLASSPLIAVNRFVLSSAFNF